MERSLVPTTQGQVQVRLRLQDLRMIVRLLVRSQRCLQLVLRQHDLLKQGQAALHLRSRQRQGLQTAGRRSLQV
jgi:hypothetical protein